MPGLDPDVLRHAISTARSHGFRSVKLRLGDERFRAVLSVADVSEEPHSEEDASAHETSELSVATGTQLTAPVVGYFRNGKQALETGRKVEAGETLGEIVALGIANDVVVKSGGEILEVLVSEGQAVEYGQVLARIGTP